MLEIHGKIHDKYTLEFKVGYSRGHKEMSVSNFVMDTWIFIPDALYINDKASGKKYRTDENYWLNITEEMLTELKKCLGDENVVVKYR